MIKILTLISLSISIILISIEINKIHLFQSYYKNYRNSHLTSYMVNNNYIMEMKILYVFLFIQLLRYNFVTWILSIFIFVYEVQKRKKQYLLSSLNFKKHVNFKYWETVIKILLQFVIFFTNIRIMIKSK